MLDKLDKPGFMYRAAFERFMKRARRGDKYVYYRGYLWAERAYHIDARAVQMAAWKAYEEGKITLVQKRLGPAEYEYIAIRKGEQKNEEGSDTTNKVVEGQLH